MHQIIACSVHGNEANHFSFRNEIWKVCLFWDKDNLSKQVNWSYHAQCSIPIFQFWIWLFLILQLYCMDQISHHLKIQIVKKISMIYFVFAISNIFSQCAVHSIIPITMILHFDTLHVYMKWNIMSMSMICLMIFFFFIFTSGLSWKWWW